LLHICPVPIQKPMQDGVTLLDAIQDLYLSPSITIA
jgi:hypothetical protein